MMTIDEVASVADGTVFGEPMDDCPFSAVVVDSRQATPGSLFVALRGQKHDGHDFVLEAFTKGAKAALVERVPEGHSTHAVTRTLPMVRVGDSLAALRALAHHWRRKLGLRVVAVTGSVGKTTTKELVATVLGTRFTVLRSEGNMNTAAGVPQKLLRATARHEILVLELGALSKERTGDLRSLVEPDVVVVTNVGPTHLERPDSIELIAGLTSRLLKGLPEQGLAVINFEDDRAKAMAVETRAAVSSYGLDARADYWADAVQSRGLKGIQFDLRSGERWVHVRMPLLGFHSVQAALAAATVAGRHGMSLEEIAAGLHELSPSLRLIVATGINGSTIVDDTYGASPASTLAALNLLSELDGRRIAVLGDMLELGAYAEEGHRMVGRRAADVADVVVGVGPLGTRIAREALEAGKEPRAVFSGRTNEEAVRHLREILRPGDCVLVKGSREMRMDEIIEAIRCPMP